MLTSRYLLVARNEDKLRLSYSTDSSYHSLYCICPFVDVRDIMRLHLISVVVHYYDRERVYLIHETKHDLLLACVFCRQLSPQVHELIICRSTLADDLTIPAGIYNTVRWDAIVHLRSHLTVVDVNHTSCPSSQAPLNKLIILPKVGSIKCATKLIVDEPLPANWKAEDVEPIIFGEVLHLAQPIRASKC